ncbi:hypothetical protein [Marinimicrococcus flavescens]|uniref:Uncharacterized protein n=1 Tax=Marinimicrococcus flavescens TaxID=3031815 RepID=A0AAP3XPZ2_9PROT|nr:hypothetical protein [Marinimicrococcus flavescens]
MATVVQARPAAAMMHVAAAFVVWALHLVAVQAAGAAACSTMAFPAHLAGGVVAPILAAAATAVASVALAAIAGTVLVRTCHQGASALLRTPCLGAVAILELAVVLQAVPVLLLQACG